MIGVAPISYDALFAISFFYTYVMPALGLFLVTYISLR